MKPFFRSIVLLLMLNTLAFCATSSNQIWDKGYTFLKFLEAYNIPLSVYWNMYAEDKELTAEIYAGVRYYTLVDDNVLIQALIPLNDETQIHIFKDGDSYKVDFIPIKYFKSNASIAISVQKSPYQDLIELTDDINLANEFVNIYKNAIDFNTKVLKEDKLALIYDYKYRLGRPFGNPEIKASLIETNRSPNFLFAYNDGKYYNERGDEVMGLSLKTPIKIKSVRISSKFSLNRMHPILKVKRPHYGVDYAAPKGTPVNAASNGIVVFAGIKNGYGNVVEIQHSNGLKTLYAHLSSYKVKKGQKVKTGQTIAQVGNTGMSTGAHLHFGLYKNNKPINPLSNIKSTTSVLAKAQKEEFLKIAKGYEEKLKIAIMDNFSGYTPNYFASN
ncbi:peptidoglycan DD-metalloendopeptidase family protein [Helicobacter sp. MIT 14-3879]|uniref:peptidoglycan DD-metalloendopeptidase family protein n=1 Tax=Helicobacter sp. MIT 14-3879 TaxID=2040649 RepID=UPI000E1F09A2|nr:peptidoglycan DD-metalloendopeptidase family protein [Helicobacter sp. MIT 14-3879]RDU65079.1 endopeptidase [Helicobacter sp. MIT 14-3879]